MSFLVSHTYNPATEKVVPKSAVVLDLDDKEIVGDPAEHLFTAAFYNRKEPSPWERHSLIVIAQQIQEQTNSPKPDEPTGLGAVVESSDGSRYVRDGVGWLPETVQGPFRNPIEWGRLEAVRVLSEGVKP